jgi:hypothetical protein
LKDAEKGPSAVKKKKEETALRQRKLERALKEKRIEYVTLEEEDEDDDIDDEGGGVPKTAEQKKFLPVEKKDEKVVKDKGAKSSFGDKITRALFGSNIANALKNGDPAASSPGSQAVAADPLPAKGPGWELADPAMAQHAMRSSAQNAEALAQKLRPR